MWPHEGQGSRLEATSDAPQPRQHLRPDFWSLILSTAAATGSTDKVNTLSTEKIKNKKEQ